MFVLCTREAAPPRGKHGRDQQLVVSGRSPQPKRSWNRVECPMGKWGADGLQRSCSS